MPRRLLWRAFLLIAGLMLAAVAAWLAIFSEAEQERRARQLAQLTASVTNLTRAAVLAARPEHRHDLLAELSEREGVRIYPAEADDRIEPPPARPFTRRFEAELQARLGAETRLAFALNDEPGLFVRFHVFPGDDGDFWLALPRERLERHFPWQWLGWGAAVLLLSLAGTWLIVYFITRPLEALEQDRALLLAGISHDLRTPLTRLRMETEMSVADAAAREAMEADILEMDRTIGQFLDFARPADAVTDGSVPTDLAALIAETAARYGTRVGVAADSQPASARVRPVALHRAIVNLIENALRHGGAPVELALRTTGDLVVIEVRDRGPGIPAAAVERLKQPFTRGEAARTDAGGAGLGLAIVERIARAHGGRLELLPRQGGGLIAQLRIARAS